MHLLRRKIVHNILKTHLYDLKTLKGLLRSVRMLLLTPLEKNQNNTDRYTMYLGNPQALNLSGVNIIHAIEKLGVTVSAKNSVLCGIHLALII